MDISSSLLAKGAAGALATTTAIGGGVWANEQGLLGDWFGKSAEVTENAAGGKVVQEGLKPTAQEVPEVVSTPSGTTDIQSPESSGPSQPPAGAPNNDPSSTPLGQEITNGLQGSGHGLSESPQNKDLTKFDQALITWLDTPGNDIVFSVKYGGNGDNEKDASNESSTTFSSFINDKSDPVKISVAVGDNSKNLKGSGEKITLKDLNGNKNWTWICKMTFKKEPKSTSIDAVNQDQVNRVYGDEEKGLFKKLMKDVSSGGDGSSEIKELKKGFIRNCAKARTEEENEKIRTGGLTNDKIETQKNKIGFVLEKGGSGNDWGTDEAELYFNEKDKFDKWFPESAAK